VFLQQVIVKQFSAVVQGDLIKTVTFHLRHRGGNSYTCVSTHGQED
jgi:hypothetical protein